MQPETIKTQVSQKEKLRSTSRRKFERLFLPAVVLLVSLLMAQVKHAEQESICGHSIARVSHERILDGTGGAARRTKRQIFNRQQQGGGRLNPPQQQQPEQEDQIVIDETGNLGDASPTNLGDSRTDARIDCSRSSGRPNGFEAPREGCPPVEQQQHQAGSQQVQKVIETAVFIDQALDSKFSGLSNGLVELNSLVLNIMNQVQRLFRYSSMKVPIKIKLVLVEHLKDVERHGFGPAPNSERGDIDLYLSNFCNWQQQRLAREKHGVWWDHAILLSGLDLFKATGGKNHSGVLGLAWVGGMCKGNYSCTINEASNLESAFVIAHEIGHSLGIMHDGQRNNCDPNGFIMSERTGAGKVHWSRCSNSYLEDSIQRRLLACLDAEQSAPSDSLLDLSKLRPPGQVYPIGDQCKLAFGANYTAFVGRQAPFNSVCRELWCVAGSWAKAAHPALEGSACADSGRVCREGKCTSSSA